MHPGSMSLIAPKGDQTVAERPYAAAMATDRALPGEARAINIRADRWRQRIPGDAWPHGLPEPPLWRQDVFEFAEDWRAGRVGSRALLVAACMWGTGMRGYGPSRTQAVLEADGNGAKLDHNLELLRADQPSDADLRTAYVRFNKASPTHLYGLGPAFFTKIMYFAGYRRGVAGVQPLILDRVVAARLPTEAGPACKRSGGWPSDHWVAYLRWAAAQASDPSFGGEPDAVEMALFNGAWPGRED